MFTLLFLPQLLTKKAIYRVTFHPWLPFATTRGQPRALPESLKLLGVSVERGRECEDSGPNRVGIGMRGRCVELNFFIKIVSLTLLTILMNSRPRGKSEKVCTSFC